MKKSEPIHPTVMKALFIGSSAYKDASKALPQAKSDVKAMMKFFTNHMDDFDLF